MQLAVEAKSALWSSVYQGWDGAYRVKGFMWTEELSQHHSIRVNQLAHAFNVLHATAP